MAEPRTQAELTVYKRVLFSNLMCTVGEQRMPYLYGVDQHPAQKDVHFKEWMYGVLDWGRRTGKTICAAAEATAELGLPNRRIWIVAPNYELTDRVFEYIYRWVVIEGCFGPGAVVKASKTRDNRYIEMAWGSFIRGKSAEAPDSLIGDQLDLIIFDECARCVEMIWLENLEPTTIDRHGRVLFISTPRGKNWFHVYYLRGQEKETQQKGWMSSNVWTSNNPFTDQDWLENKRAEVPEQVWRREYEGSFEDFGGNVFPEFAPKLWTDGGHLFDPTVTRIPLDGTRYRGIDVGFRLPTACVWASVDEKGSVWIYQEYEEANLVHEDHAQNIVAKTLDEVYQTYISPDAARRFGNSRDASERANSPLAVYRDHGVFARQADDSVNPGLSVIARYLRATLEDAPTHPGLYISLDCPKLIASLETYMFQEVQNRTDLDQPDKPRKYNDHLPDALRYLLTAHPRYMHTWRAADKDDHLAVIQRYGLENTNYAHKRTGKKSLRRKTGKPRILIGADA